MKNALLLLLLSSNLSVAQHFSETVNPTGNPIGGGIGYTRIIKEKDAAYVVSNLQGLKDALSKAASGEIIYLKDGSEVNLSSEKNLSIPAGVTLAGGRGATGDGALLYSDSFYTPKDFTAMLVTGGSHVRITGLRLRGPNPDILDMDYSGGVANGIRSKHPALEVDNCELWAWDKWAVWLYISDSAYIHHNYIHHTQRAGYGYPVWCGGAGGEKYANALIEANLFESARHCVASSGHLNSWEGRYNVIMKRQHFVNFDRHGERGHQGQGLGGVNTHLHHNLFFSTQVHFGFSLPNDPSGMLEIDHNWFVRDGHDTISTFGFIGRTPAPLAHDPQLSIHDNFFNGEGRTLPVAIITSSADSGTAPLTVKFDSKKSVDNDGKKITNYQWRFGNGNYAGDEKRTAAAAYTFTEPGVYLISLIVFNAVGIPSEQANKKIIVKPAVGKYVLSAWVKDTYNDTLKGNYEKQLLVDDKILWHDDIEANEGWQHIVLHLDKEAGMTSGSKHKITARLASIAGSDSLPEVTMYVDDVYLFNSDLAGGDFEDKSVSPPWQAKTTSQKFGAGLITEDSRSGEHSYRMRFSRRDAIPPGVYEELYQLVLLK